MTFLGASHYLYKLIGAARPILALNALYHIYLMAKIIHAQQGIPFFSEESFAAVLLMVGGEEGVHARSRKTVSFRRPYGEDGHSSYSPAALLLPIASFLLDQ